MFLKITFGGLGIHGYRDKQNLNNTKPSEIVSISNKI